MLLLLTVHESPETRLGQMFFGSYILEKDSLRLVWLWLEEI